nr:DNA-directed RNA polymerase subunit delta [Evansella tamaricis]
MAMLEVAYELLKESRASNDYYALLKEVAATKGLTEEQMTKRIAHLYTEMSVDGRFVNVGDNQWGLRAWFPFDQTEEELSQANKTRKKKRREEDEDDYLEDDEEDFDEFEDLEDELDELANEEDEDYDSDDDDDDADIDEEFDEEEEEELDIESDEDEVL